jgi:GNAT superfamily N-acetyltransferase
MTVTYRRAKSADGPSAARIVWSWGQETPWMTTLFDLDRMTEWWSQRFETDHVWIGENSEGVIGFCARDEDNIDGLYVHTEMRGKGVGKRLLDLAKENRDWITVWAHELNTEARRFYRREGLVEIWRETERHEDGVSLVDIEHRWERSVISK